MDERRLPQLPAQPADVAVDHVGHRRVVPHLLERALAREHASLLDQPAGAWLAGWRQDARGAITVRALLALVEEGIGQAPATKPLNPFRVTARLASGPDFESAALAVFDEGIIPADEADDLFILVGVFIHWEAADDAKIQKYNYEATKLSIQRAVNGEPKASTVTEQRNSAQHPFAANA